MRKMMTVSLAVVFSVFYGCGGSNGDSGSSEANVPQPIEEKPAYYTMTIAEEAELPVCGDENNLQLVYIESIQTFKSCKAGAWADIDIKGKDGVAGAAGSDGKDGKDGTDNKITSSIYCGGNLEDTSLYFHYSVAVMDSGDVFANGSIRANDTQASETNFFSKNQNGSLTGRVIMTFDMMGDANAGYWEILLDRKTLVTTIRYNDLDIGNDEILVWTMNPEACIVNSYE